jgi:hypothetical protein
MNFTAVIPTNIFGKHDNFHLEDSKCNSPDHLRLALKDCLTEEPRA